MGSKHPNNDAVCEFQSLRPVFKPFDGSLVFGVNAVLKSEGLGTRKGGFEFLPLAANRDRIKLQFFACVVFECFEVLEKSAERGVAKLVFPSLGAKGIDEGILIYNGFHYLNRASIARRSLQLPEGKRGKFKLR